MAVSRVANSELPNRETKPVKESGVNGIGLSCPEQYKEKHAHRSEHHGKQRKKQETDPPLASVPCNEFPSQEPGSDGLLDVDCRAVSKKRSINYYSDRRAPYETTNTLNRNK